MWVYTLTHTCMYICMPTGIYTYGYVDKYMSLGLRVCLCVCLCLHGHVIVYLYLDTPQSYNPRSQRSSWRPWRETRTCLIGLRQRRTPRKQLKLRATWMMRCNSTGHSGCGLEFAVVTSMHHFNITAIMIFFCHRRDRHRPTSLLLVSPSLSSARPSSMSAATAWS